MGGVVNRFLNVRTVVAYFNQEKALVGAFCVIIKLQTSRRFVSSSTSSSSSRLHPALASSHGASLARWNSWLWPELSSVLFTCFKSVIEKLLLGCLSSSSLLGDDTLDAVFDPEPISRLDFLLFPKWSQSPNPVNMNT